MNTESRTLLFTDIVGSTELAQRFAPDRADEIRRNHFASLREAIGETGGIVVKNLGDGLMVVFVSASDAISCAVAMQQRVERDNRGLDYSIRLRIGMSQGEITSDDGDYFGDAVIEAARLCAQCEGGQILAASVVRLMAGRRNIHPFRSAGQRTLKGLPSPVEVIEVLWAPEPETQPELPAPVLLSPLQPAIAPPGHGASVTLVDSHADRAARRGQTPWWRRGVLVAALVLVIGVVVVVKLVGGSKEPTSGPQVEGVSETQQLSSHGSTTLVLRHRSDLTDQSVVLNASIADLEPVVVAATADVNPKQEPLTVEEGFTSAQFPEMAPLPTTATWIFTNHDTRNTGICNKFVPRPPTMEGFAGVAFAGNDTNVFVITYTFQTPQEAADFFTGRTMLLGTSPTECTIPSGSDRPVIVHRDFVPSEVPTFLSEWNTWTISDPKSLIFNETGAFGFLGRAGRQMFEITVGVTNPTAMSNASVSKLIDGVLTTARPAS